MQKQPAVFLDRDGTIIEDRGYLHSVDDVHFIPEAVASLLRLQEHFMLFIVTHQPGVARGLISPDDVALINNHVSTHLRDNGVSITETYVCPHDRTEGCHCIKPRPFFLNRAADHYNLDLSRSYVVGDHPHDVELGTNAGATGLYVLTGHGKKHRHELPEESPVFNSIADAAAYIMSATH